MSADACPLTNYLKFYEQILNEIFRDNGPRNSSLNFGDVLDFGTLTFDLPEIKGQGDFIMK